MRWTEAQLAQYTARRSTPPMPTARTRKGVQKLVLAASETEIHEAVGDQPPPNAPPAPPASHTRRNAVSAALTEADVHLAVVAHLRARCRPDVHWHHPATGELRDPGTARKLQRMGVKPGLPDFLLLIEGRLHGLELKRVRGGRVSPDQKAMHVELVAAGAVVAVAKGLDEALSVLTSWGAFGPAKGKDRRNDRDRSRLRRPHRQWPQHEAEPGREAILHDVGCRRYRKGG